MELSVVSRCFDCVLYLTGSGPKSKTPGSAEKQKETKIQLPGLSIFRENIHWLSDGEQSRDKRPKKKLRENEEHRKAEHKRKGKKRERKRENPETSIVLYHGVNSTDRVENDSPENVSGELEGWDTVSIDSVSL
jgi:hypothetical protein